jgi:hypothetical protein
MPGGRLSTPAGAKRGRAQTDATARPGGGHPRAVGQAPGRRHRRALPCRNAAEGDKLG